MKKIFDLRFSPSSNLPPMDADLADSLLMTTNKRLREREALFTDLCNALPEQYFYLLPCMKYVYFAEILTAWNDIRKSVYCACSDESLTICFADLDQRLYDLQDGVFLRGGMYFKKHFPNTKPEDILTECKIIVELLTSEN